MSDMPSDRRRAPELMLRLEGYLPASGAHVQMTTAVYAATRSGMKDIRAELADIFRCALALYLDDPVLRMCHPDAGLAAEVRLVAMPGRTGYVTHGADEASVTVEAWLVAAVVSLRA